MSSITESACHVQGWRIEIKAFPKLTEKGAWRGRAGAKGYGGFYSQQQVLSVSDR